MAEKTERPSGDLQTQFETLIMAEKTERSSGDLQTQFEAPSRQMQDVAHGDPEGNVVPSGAVLDHFIIDHDLSGQPEPLAVEEQTAHCEIATEGSSGDSVIDDHQAQSEPLAVEEQTAHREIAAEGSSGDSDIDDCQTQSESLAVEEQTAREIATEGSSGDSVMDDSQTQFQPLAVEEQTAREIVTEGSSGDSVIDDHQTQFEQPLAVEEQTAHREIATEGSCWDSVIDDCQTQFEAPTIKDRQMQEMGHGDPGGMVQSSMKCQFNTVPIGSLPTSVRFSQDDDSRVFQDEQHNSINGFLQDYQDINHNSGNPPAEIENSQRSSNSVCNNNCTQQLSSNFSNGNPPSEIGNTEGFFISDTERLSSDHIEVAQRIIRNQFPAINGFQMIWIPKVDHTETNWSYGKRRDSVQPPAAQIHHNGRNHWVTSVLDVDGTVWVLDSSINYKVPLSESLKIQLAVIYGQDREFLPFKIPYIQQQTNDDDCGLFAIANMVEFCCFKFDYFGKNYHVTFDTAVMRAHLLACIEKQHFTPFPRVENINYYIECSPIFSKLHESELLTSQRDD